MPKITFLGTASAVPDANHQNSHLVIEGGNRVVLVDCPGNPFVRLRQAKIDPLLITDLILTHFHPDHVSGVPLLLMDLWLQGRESPLTVYGLAEVIDKTKQMMALYEWETWDGFYPVNFRSLPEKEMMPLIESGQMRAWASFVCHMIPGIGVRLAFSKGEVCYSSDTGPCEAVVQLAMGVDILIHEATGQSEGHTSAEQAGEIAQRAGVGSLYLIHYSPHCDSESLITRAKTTFDGQVKLAKDLMRVTF